MTDTGGSVRSMTGPASRAALSVATEMATDRRHTTIRPTNPATANAIRPTPPTPADRRTRLILRMSFISQPLPNSAGQDRHDHKQHAVPR
jgi:hypothetical protein